MKQSTYKAQLNQFIDDVDYYIDTLVQCNVELSVLDKILEDRMNALGVDSQRDYADMMFDIIANEEDAREKGEEPVRRVFYHYDDTDEPLDNWDDHAVWINYTEDDYYFLVALKNRMEQQTVVEYTRIELNASFAIMKHFNEDADLTTAGCLSILHTVTKADCEEYLRRTREYVKATIDNKETEAFVLKRIQADKAGTIEIDFLGNILNPFEMAIQALRQEERKKQEDQDPKDFIDFVFKDIRRINEEIRDVVSQWYGVPSREGNPQQRHSKLIQSKEINALQSLNLARDNKGTRHRSTRSGGLVAERFFENNNVEIVSSRIDDLSLSTSSRQLLDFFRSKATEQITHKCGDLNRLDRERAVTVSVDEVALKFFGNTSANAKKEARKLLTTFYDETRDLKVRVHYWKKEGNKSKEYTATVNIFDADVQEIDLEEKNATARPEDVDEGVQITFYNTGTLLNYNPKKKRTSNAVVKQGKLTMQYSMTFAKHLSQSPVMKHNERGYLLDKKKYKPAYSLQYALEVHAYRNRDKSNAGVISLGSLLKDCYEIPTYDEVKKGNRNYTDRIKKPLTVNLRALKDANILTSYEYHDPKRAVISEKKLLSLDYDDFIKCTLHFELAPIEE